MTTHFDWFGCALAKNLFIDYLSVDNSARTIDDLTSVKICFYEKEEHPDSYFGRMVGG